MEPAASQELDDDAEFETYAGGTLCLGEWIDRAAKVVECQTCVEAPTRLAAWIGPAVGARAKVHVPQIEVAFGHDANGIINMSAKDTVFPSSKLAEWADDEQNAKKAAAENATSLVAHASFHVLEEWATSDATREQVGALVDQALTGGTSVHAGVVAAIVAFLAFRPGFESVLSGLTVSVVVDWCFAQGSSELGQTIVLTQDHASLLLTENGAIFRAGFARSSLSLLHARQSGDSHIVSLAEGAGSIFMLVLRVDCSVELRSLDADGAIRGAAVPWPTTQSRLLFDARRRVLYGTVEEGRSSITSQKSSTSDRSVARAVSFVVPDEDESSTALRSLTQCLYAPDDLLSTLAGYPVIEVPSTLTGYAPIIALDDVRRQLLIAEHASNTLSFFCADTGKFLSMARLSSRCPTLEGHNPAIVDLAVLASDSSGAQIIAFFGRVRQRRMGGRQWWVRPLA